MDQSANFKSATAIEYLRQKTRNLHHHLENRFDVIALLRDTETHHDIRTRYEHLFSSVDKAIRPFLAPVRALEFAKRAETWPVAQTPAPVLQGISNFPQALGVMYVVEGSRLGGRVILRSLRAEGVEPEGFAFLDPYGSDAGQMWRSFIAVIENEIKSPEDLEALADGAIQGFLHAENILCGGRN